MRQETRDRRCETADMSHVALKGQCHKICNTFLPKNHLGPIWIGKMILRKKLVFANIFAKVCNKNVCLRSHWLRWHGVSLVVDYADMKSAWSMTTLTLSLHGHWLWWHCVSILCRHCVRVVVDYVNTCQHCQWICWDMVNYFTLEEEKLKIKVTKSWIWSFRNFCVHVVIEYTDMMSL